MKCSPVAALPVARNHVRFHGGSVRGCDANHQRRQRCRSERPLHRSGGRSARAANTQLTAEAQIPGGNHTVQ